MSDTLSAFLGTDSLFIGTIIPFLFVLTVVVFVHEMGHYLVGRWCGIGVKAFSIGFGPELLGFNDRHGTRWMISAIPLGGYVKFVGDMSATSAPDAGEIEALTDAAIGHLGSLGHGASRGCVRDLAAFSKAVDYSGGGREATRPRVRSVSVDGDRAMATVAVVDGPSGEVPLAKEDGEWKVDALYGGIPAAEQRDKFQ